MRRLDRLTYRVDDIERIAVVRSAEAEPEAASLTIRVADQETVVAEEQLVGLPGVGDRENQWRLLDVVGLVAPQGKVVSVTVLGEDDGSVAFARPALVSGRGTPVLRLNRRRQLRLNHLGDEGGGGNGGGNKQDAAGAMRDVHGLRVELRP
jgi:hypothetical protein